MAAATAGREGAPDGTTFAQQMSKATASADQEGAHADADALMVGLLRALGYGEAMDIYEDAPKWYA